MKEPKLTRPCDKLFRIFKFKGRTITLCSINTPKTINIALSICSPDDVFDESKGKHIAKARAIHENAIKRKLLVRSIYFEYSYNIINRTYGLHDLLLREVEEMIKLNPKQYIKGLK